jgi:hypothetical protein
LSELAAPIVVEFGNSGKISATQTVTLQNVFDQPDVEFLVVPKLSVNILFGQSDILRFDVLPRRQLNLSLSPCDLSSKEVQVDTNSLFDSNLSNRQFIRNDNGQIEVQCPMFEHAAVIPWREKERNHSVLELEIIDEILRQMIDQKQVRPVPPDEILVTQQLILVDKYLAKGIVEPKCLPIQQGRYRLVLDCRPANALRYDSASHCWLVNSMLFGNKPSDTNETRQSQHSALFLVESIPLHQRRFYVKLDLSNAFYSVKVSNSLSKLFGFKHRNNYFAFTVLPMGWFLSPLVFHDVITYIINHSSLDPTVSVVHQQDDILISGASEEIVKTAMVKLIEVFGTFGFTVRPEKCEGPSGSVTFCGLKLFEDGSVKPWPVKRQLTEIAASSAAEMFARSKTAAETKHILRSWLGTANYFNKWLPPELRVKSLELHSLLPLLENGEVSRSDVIEKSVDFINKLCTFWLTESYGLYGGSTSEDTLVITDSNQSGWTGCVLKLIERDQTVSDSGIPFSLDGLLSNKSETLIPETKSSDDYALVPVRFDGGRWETVFERSQSSTWRERAAAMLAIHRNKECLSGKVWLLSDNKNLVGSWKSAESLTSALCNAFESYTSHVSGAIHIQRSHPVIKWVDLSARNLSNSESVLVSKRLPDTDLPVDPVKKPKYIVPEVSSFPSPDPVSSTGPSPMVIDSPALSAPLTSTIPSNTTVGHYTSNEINPLMSKGWISRRGDRFFTTERFSGNVSPNSLIVPTCDALDVIRFIHYNYGHPTIAGTIKILRLWKLHIVNFKDSVSTIFTSCKHCLTCRDTYHPQRSFLPVASKPMEILMADFIQPDKSKLPGFLIFRDRYSGLTEGRAIERFDSFEIKQLLIEWIARYGSPHIFISDNAESFKSDLLRQLFVKYKITHRPTPVYEPQANGSVERTIKTIEEGLRMELSSGIPPQEAIHVICGRINRTCTVPGNNSLDCPRSAVFAFTESHPFDMDSGRKEHLKHDLKVGQRVLTKVAGASKFEPQFEDKNLHILRYEGNHIYALADATGKETRVLYRRERLKPIPATLSHLENNALGIILGEGM